MKNIESVKLNICWNMQIIKHTSYDEVLIG